MVQAADQDQAVKRGGGFFRQHGIAVFKGREKCPDRHIPLQFHAEAEFPDIADCGMADFGRCVVKITNKFLN